MAQDEQRILDYDVSDEEASSEEDEEQDKDNIIPMPNSEEPGLLPITVTAQTKIEFYATLLLLITSTTTLLIVLPLYISRIYLKGNFVSISAINLPFSTVALVASLSAMKFIFGKFKLVKIMSLPMGIWTLIRLSLVYLSLTQVYMFCTSRNRVWCHMQDPLKGFMLVFALLGYFCCCRTFMGLHRIFSTTAIIVGLFITLDYGLCNEFVCRGYDIKSISDDRGPWLRLSNIINTLVYIVSFNFFTFTIIILDRILAPNMVPSSSSIIHSSYVNTISRSVGNLEETPGSTIEEISKKSALHIVAWLHIFSIVCFLCVSIIGVPLQYTHIPGTVTDPTLSFNVTMQGILCHFKNEGDCQYVLTYSVIFQLAYLVFIVSLVKMLMLSQCPVFTVAATSASLPFVGIWWSFFYASPTGLMVWSPKIRGESVCSIIGLVIVIIGLGLLCKAHFEGDDRYKRGSRRRMVR